MSPAQTARTALGIAASLLALAVPARALDVVRLTADDTDPRNPRIDGTRVVWEGEDADWDSEIYLYDGAGTVQLTHDQQDDTDPAVSDAAVVWQHWDGSDWEIVLHDGFQPTQLTDDEPAPPDNAYDRDPDVSDGTVVWAGFVYEVGATSDPSRIFRYDGVNASPWVSGGDGVGVFQPAISGDALVYVQYDETGPSAVGPSVWLLAGAWSQQLSLPGRLGFNPDIAGSRIVWQELPPDSEVSDVVLYDGGTTTPLTDDAADDSYPRVSNELVVWQRRDDGDWEIWVYDGSRAWQLTDNETDDEHPDVSGRTVVWEASDGLDIDIVMATVPEPAPAAAALVALHALGAASPHQRRRGARNRVPRSKL